MLGFAMLVCVVFLFLFLTDPGPVRAGAVC
jgi:hypothetical protein